LSSIIIQTPEDLIDFDQRHSGASDHYATQSCETKSYSLDFRRESNFVYCEITPGVLIAWDPAIAGRRILNEYLFRIRIVIYREECFPE
jgi:hypothetical protein